MQLTAVALEKARQLELRNKRLTEELGKAKDTARILKTEKVFVVTHTLPKCQRHAAVKISSIDAYTHA